MMYQDRPRDASGRIGPKQGFEFTVPDGLDLKGDKGTASIRWKRMPNGKVCVTSMNGVSMCDDAPMMAGKKDNEGAEPAPGDNEMDEGEMG